MERPLQLQHVAPGAVVRAWWLLHVPRVSVQLTERFGSVALPATEICNINMRGAKFGGGRSVADALRAMPLPNPATDDGIAANSRLPGHFIHALRPVDLPRYQRLAGTVRLHYRRLCSAEHAAFTIAGLLPARHLCSGTISR